MAAICAALAIGAGGPAASAMRAPGGGSAGWRVVQYFGQCTSAGVLSVTATGPLSAWATGQAWRFQCDQPGLLIARWDGRTWQDLKPPKAFGVAPGEQSIGDAVAALSSSYSWTFVNRARYPDAAVESFALLWRNGSWRTFRLPDSTTFFSAVMFSRSDAWAFGGIAPDVESPRDLSPYAVRFNGTRWRSVAIPVVPLGTAAPAPRNIWAVGPVTASDQPTGTYELTHWNGKRWSTVKLPFLQDVSGYFTGASVVSDGSHGAWVAVDLESFNENQFTYVPSGGALLHWTGRVWQEVRLPFKTVGLGPLAHDGRGGLWVASMRPPLCTACDDLDMGDYRAGRWTIKRLHVPGATVTAMRLIPGTTSVWASAAGALASDGQGDTTGAILKYGP